MIVSCVDVPDIKSTIFESICIDDLPLLIPDTLMYLFFITIYKIIKCMKIIVCHRNPTDLIVAFDFVSALNRATAGNGNVDDVSDFLEPWIQSTGYPVLHVGWRSENVVLLTQVSLSCTKNSIGTLLYKLSSEFLRN